MRKGKEIYSPVEGTGSAYSFKGSVSHVVWAATFISLIDQCISSFMDYKLQSKPKVSPNVPKPKRIQCYEELQPPNFSLLKST